MLLLGFAGLGLAAFFRRSRRLLESARWQGVSVNRRSDHAAEISSYPFSRRPR